MREKEYFLIMYTQEKGNKLKACSRNFSTNLDQIVDSKLGGEVAKCVGKYSYHSKHERIRKETLFT